jgi:hypothetical protein
MKLMTKEEKILNDGLEKVSEKKDNMNWISSLAFFDSIGCSPFWAKVKLALSLAYYRITAFLIPISKSARLQSISHSAKGGLRALIRVEPIIYLGRLKKTV